MDSAEYRWMRKPTTVTTSVKTSDRASRRKAMAGLSPPTWNQVQKVTVRAPSAGGAMRNQPARTIASPAASPTVPTPIAATRRLGIVRPRNARTANPNRGRTGMSQRRVVMSALHRAHGVGIEGLEMAADLEEQGQPDRDLGRRHGEDEDEDDLPVGPAPARPGGDEGQAGRVDHDLERHQDEEQAAPGEKPGQAQDEEDAGDGEHGLVRNAG